MSNQKNLSYKNTAEDRTRTCTGLYPLDPEYYVSLMFSSGCKKHFSPGAVEDQQIRVIARYKK
jgi:hypothetical protein